MTWFLALAALTLGVLLIVVCFCVWLVRHTGTSASLRDFAVVLRALPRPPTVNVSITRQEKGRGS